MASLTATADQNAVHFLTTSESTAEMIVEGNINTLNQEQTTILSEAHVAFVAEVESTEQDIESAGAFEEVGNNEDEEEPVIDIVINNVVSSFNTRCHLNLKRIAMEGINVEYKRQNGMLNMKIRRPYTTASIWSSGKITCTGATSEDEARTAARRFARILQKLGFSVKFCNFRVVNVLATCSLPFGIKITDFSRDNPRNASYEPELHPGVTYKLKCPKATLKIFSTGSITVTAPCVANVQVAIEHIFPLVYEYRSLDLLRSSNATIVNKSPCGGNRYPVQYPDLDGYFAGDEGCTDSDDTFDSETSDD